MNIETFPHQKISKSVTEPLTYLDFRVANFKIVYYGKIIRLSLYWVLLLVLRISYILYIRDVTYAVNPLL